MIECARVLAGLTSLPEAMHCRKRFDKPFLPRTTAALIACHSVL